jgi:putative transcriptional regulator
MERRNKMKRPWLKKIRMDRGMTQQELSRKAKINRSFYTQIENGKRNPSPYTAQRIADVLKTDWTYFYTFDCGVSQLNKEEKSDETGRKNHRSA